MGKRRHRDAELWEGLDRALAFDRVVDQVRRSSPFLFPPEITCEKCILDDGSTLHVYHHRALGELGRILLEYDGGRTRTSCEVAGDASDPKHAERDALFSPLVKEIARASGNHCIQSKRIPCERCGSTAALLIFAPDGTGPGGFEDYARLMYSEYFRSNTHVWIIGPSLGSGPEPDRPADILKIWPERAAIQRFTPAEFNPLLDRIVAAHCLRR